MTNQELYKQAILDAKAVRETALAAAKESLSEVFEPRIKEMMRIKLSEELEETGDIEEAKEEMEESMGTEDESKMEETTEDNMDESYLDEILAELDSISEELEENEELEEGHNKADGYVGTKGKGGTGYDEKAKTSKGDHKLHEADEEKEKVEDEETPEGEEEEVDVTTDTDAGGDEGPVSDDEAVVDIKVGELKDIFRTVFAQLQGGAAPAMGAEPATDEENAMTSAGGPEEMEEISLEEILAELEDESKMEENVNKPGTVRGAPGDYSQATTAIEEKKKMDQMKKDLEEANKTVKTMKEELNEINLLNAKLLYFNKILKAKTLQESQKVKVMNAFDRATNVKEVENTYKTLSESLAAPKKTALKESIGFASKAIGNAPAKPIVETDAFVSRWQILAGIK